MPIASISALPTVAPPVSGSIATRPQTDFSLAALFDFGFAPLLNTLLGTDLVTVPESEQDLTKAAEPDTSVPPVNVTDPGAKEKTAGKDPVAVSVATLLGLRPVALPVSASGDINESKTSYYHEDTAAVETEPLAPALDEKIPEPEPARAAAVGAVPVPLSVPAPLTLPAPVRGTEVRAREAPRAGVVTEGPSEAPESAITGAAGRPSELAFAVRAAVDPAQAEEPVFEKPEAAPKQPDAISATPDEGGSAEDASADNAPGSRKDPEPVKKTSKPEVAAPAPEPAGSHSKEHREAPGEAAPKQPSVEHFAPLTPARAQTPSTGDSHRAEAKPPAASAEAPAPPEKPKAPAPNQLSIKVERPGEKDVSLQVTQRAGEVHVAVRSDDSRLNSALRSDLNDLVSNLKQHGFKSETWSPSDVAAPAARAGQGEMNSSGNEAFREGGGYRQQQQQQRHNEQQEQPEWVDELESSFSSAANLHERR